MMSFMKKKMNIGITGFAVIALNGAVFYAAQATTTAQSVSTVSAITGAKWNTTVKLAYSETSVIMQPDGIPNHPRDAYYAVPRGNVVVPKATTAMVVKDPTKTQIYKFTIPTNPKYSKTTTKTSLGSIGVMISGAVLYNPFEGDGKTVAMASNFTITNSAGITASFVDKCAGHPTPNSGAYHYHGLSGCVTSKVDAARGPSHVIGFALDGFPIYGDRDIKGKRTTVKDLDACNGINSSTPEFPKGIYHYILLATADVHSSISCFHGVVDVSQIQAMPPMGMGGGPMR